MSMTDFTPPDVRQPPQPARRQPSDIDRFELTGSLPGFQLLRIASFKPGAMVLRGICKPSPRKMTRYLISHEADVISTPSGCCLLAAVGRDGTR